MISMVAMRCVFYVCWPDSEINFSDAMHVFYGRTTISMIAMQCVFCVFWQDSDINGSDAMRVFLWQDNDINGSDAMRLLCILARQRY